MSVRYTNGMGESAMKVTCEIPLRLPSLNDYTKDCRTGPYIGAKKKKDTEANIALWVQKIPVFEKPIKIHFTWIEENERRDPDNICFAKKFILDTMVKEGKLQNDNRKWVKAFTDDFETAKESKVILEIEEVEE